MKLLHFVSILLAVCFISVKGDDSLPGTCDDLNHCSRTPQPGGKPPAPHDPNYPGLPGTCAELKHCERLPQPGGKQSPPHVHDPDIHPQPCPHPRCRP